MTCLDFEGYLKFSIINQICIIIPLNHTKNYWSIINTLMTFFVSEGIFLKRTELRPLNSHEFCQYASKLLWPSICYTILQKCFPLRRKLKKTTIKKLRITCETCIQHRAIQSGTLLWEFRFQLGPAWSVGRTILTPATTTSTIGTNSSTSDRITRTTLFLRYYILR